MSANESTPQKPSLRMEELAISNFRTFRERTVIPFRSAKGKTDEMAVFHGNNGSGKSNALAALDLFFQTAVLSLRQPNEEGDVLIPWNQPYSVTGIHGSPMLVLAYRDRPYDSSDPMEIEVQFSDPSLGRLRSVCTPSGEQVRVQLLREGGVQGAFAPIPREERDPLVTRLWTPRGVGSQPIAIVDARRKQPGPRQDAYPSLMPPDLADVLFTFRTSRDPRARDVWRTFVQLLHRFASFKGKEISIEPSPASHPEIVVEERGRTVLGLDELSSGEQQIIVLCAASLLAHAPVLAIQEPEISLDPTNQRLLRSILDGLLSSNIVDQIILESHVPFFDGPDVIRFHRDEKGTTRVSREPSHDEAARETERRAKEQGAKQRWVTRGGFTELPESMREDLALKDGGHVWFLKGKQHWEAWPEAKVDEFFRGGEGDGDD